MDKNTLLSQLPLRFQRTDQYHSFASFLIGDNLSVVTQLNDIVQGNRGSNVYIWAGDKLGKTHLLQATYHQASQYDLRVAYVSLSQTNAFRDDKLYELSEYDIVCIDNFEAIATQKLIQQSLICLYDEFIYRQKSILIGSKIPPEEMALEFNDLRSRLASMLIYKLKTPDDSLKFDILKQQANILGFELSDEVARYLLNHLRRDLLSLLKALDQLDDISIRLKKPITIPLLKKFLAEYVQNFEISVS